MSHTSSTYFPTPVRKKQQQAYYIVKDDFISNLRKDSKLIKHRQSTEPVDPTYLVDSAQMVRKKEEIFSKMKFRSNNDFCELQKQIKSNTRTIYRKLTIALRRTRLDCNVKMQNPFVRSQSMANEPNKKFNKDRNLSELIMQVQPYWIKKSIGKAAKAAI